MLATIPKSVAGLLRAMVLAAPLLFAGGPVPAAQPRAQIVLGEDQVVRFAASLPQMRAIGARLVETAVRETNPDNPLDAFEAQDAPPDGDPALTQTLAEHGFASLEDWLDVGHSVMLAYRLNKDTIHNLAAQMAQIVVSLKWRDEPDPIAYARLVNKLKADLIANAAELPLAGNARLLKKHRASIERGLRGTY